MTDEISLSLFGMASMPFPSALTVSASASSYTTRIICMLSLSVCDSKCSPMITNPSMDSVVELPMLSVL